MERTTKGVKVNGEFFEYLNTREYVPVSVFKGANRFLRLGPSEVLQPELSFHKSLLEYGFPVPKIVDSGELDGKFYYSETSVGDELMGDIFWEDTKTKGCISKKNFQAVLELSKIFARAQLNSATTDRDEESFYIGIHMDLIQQELPELKDEVLAAFEKAKDNTESLPYVLTHGDLSAYNLLEKGVIDFGSAFHAPAGYDLVSNTHHTYFFPKTGDYEMMRRYEFTPEQLQQYYGELDKIYQSAGLAKLSEHIDDFIFCRSIWTTVRMDRYPKVKEYRNAKFRQLVKQYLAGEPITNLEK